MSRWAPISHSGRVTTREPSTVTTPRGMPVFCAATRSIVGAPTPSTPTAPMRAARDDSRTRVRRPWFGAARSTWAPASPRGTASRAPGRGRSAAPRSGPATIRSASTRMVEARALRARHLVREGERGERGLQQHQGPGRTPPSTAEVTSFAPKEWPIRCTRGARSPRPATAGASSSRPSRSPTCPARRFISQKLSACSGDGAHPAPVRGVADLAHERIQLELVLGAQRHLGLAEQREHRRERARARDAPARRGSRAAPAALGDRARRAGRHPRRASTASGSPPAAGPRDRPAAAAPCPDARRTAARRRAPRAVVQPAVAEDEAVGRGGQPRAEGDRRAAGSRAGRRS